MSLPQSQNLARDNDLSKPIIRNQLLQLLSPNDQKLVENHCEFVLINPNELISGPGLQNLTVDFIETGICSIIAEAGGREIEVAIFGGEGVSGIGAVLNNESFNFKVVSQMEGSAWRMEQKTFRRLLQNSEALTHACQRFVLSMFEQSAQNVACNAAHTVNQRLAKWLLLSHEKCYGAPLAMTQTFLSRMVGIRRGSICRAASLLQADGIISYSRGSIKILDAASLEAISCSCYAKISRASHALGAAGA